MSHKFCRNVYVGLCLLAVGVTGYADQRFIVLQSTTSTRNSGLYDYLLPIFSKVSDVQVRVVAVGTGQALKNARNGDADVLLVHSRVDEEKFVAEGIGRERFDLMYNDFVIVGPKSDPAGVYGLKRATEALVAIAHSGMLFVSRGDGSGTHKKELTLWNSTDVKLDEGNGRWYLETGSSMGATLNIAVGKNAYTITDRATWISFKNQQSFEILLEGDPELFNQYGVILVNSDYHPHVKTVLGQAFIDWLLSSAGQDAIASFKIEGKQLFYPNAKN